MDVRSEAQHDPKDAEQQDRRRFIEAATKFTAVLAALGITADEWVSIAHASGGTQKSPNVPAVQQPAMTKMAADRKAVGEILKAAIQSKSMDSAIKNSPTQLSDAQAKALKGLSRQDLDALSRVQGKLAPIGAAEGDGYIIY